MEQQPDSYQDNRNGRKLSKPDGFEQISFEISKLFLDIRLKIAELFMEFCSEVQYFVMDLFRGHMVRKKICNGLPKGASRVRGPALF